MRNRSMTFSVLFLLACAAVLMLPQPISAKYIGADPPRRECGCCSCPSPQPLERSDTSSMVDRSAGNLIERLGLPGIMSGAGGSIALTAVYNTYNADASRAQVDTVMGYGWTHSYNVFLFDQLGAMFRFDGEGRVTKYGLGAGGTYLPQTGDFETLVKNGDGSFTLKQKDKTTYVFAQIAGTPFLAGGPVWRLTTVTDRNGNVTTLTYTSGNLTTITNTYGRSLTFAYNAQNKLVSITDPAGRVTTFTYDATGHKLNTMTDPAGRTITYTYNTLYQVTTKVDRAGRRFTYLYANNLPVSVKDSSGGTTATLSNPGNWATDTNALASSQMRVYAPSTTTNTDGRGNLWKYQYDANGYITKITAPDGAATTYTYDSGTLMPSSKTDADGNTTSYQYDSQGNRVKMTDAQGHVTTYTYEATFNMMTSMTDPLGRTNSYAYDANGNRISETDHLGQTRTWTYDSNGNIITQTDKNGHTTTSLYDAFGDRVKTTDPLGNATTMTYDADGNMISRTDANSHSTTYQYDGLNRLIKETDATGHTTQTMYDAESNRTQIIDRNGHTTSYQYDGRQRLIKMTDAAGKPETYTYDGNDNRISITDRDAHTTTTAYDVQNRPITVTDALGDVTQSAYDPAGNVTSQTDANGHTTTSTYDSLNRRITMTDALGDVTQSQYDGGSYAGCSPSCGATPGSSLVTGRIDANGKATYYKYDALDRLIKTVRKVGSTLDTITPSDAVTTTTYDAVGNRLTTTEPDGITTTDQYDADDRRIKQTNGAGDVTTATYDSVGNVITITRPNLNVTTYFYDSLDRVVQVTDSVGLAAKYTYDPAGNRTSESDGNGNKTTCAYDSLDRIITTIDPLGKTSSDQYDAVGNLIKDTDRNGNVSTYQYDAINRRTRTTDALGNVTQFQYDPAGNLTRMTDANGHATQYFYDFVNRPSQETYADGRSRYFTYDGVGNLITRKDQLNQTTTYAYNDLYFMTGRSYPSAINDTFTYDLSGRMTAAQRGTWPVTFTYDGANRITQTIQNSRVITYSYNIPGRTRTVVYPGGRSITETTDARTRLDHIDDVGSPPSIVQYTYDLGNRTVSRSLRNGTTTAYTYNANDWTTNLQHSKGVTPIAGYAYDYDNEGNKKFEKKLQDLTHSEAYQYDTTYRLISYKVGSLVGSTVPSPLTQTSYSLDPVGNWNSKTTDAVTQNRVHDAVNELVKIDATNLAYDFNGNLQNDGSYSYQYDEENRLTGAQRNSDSAIVGQYQYDALGRRTQKVANPAGSPATTLYFYDDARMIEEQNGGGTTQATYVYGNYVDETLTMTRGISVYYYHQNALWSVEAVTDGAGTPVERYSYDAYGQVTVTNGAGTPVAPNAWGTPHSAILNSFLFTGRQLDEETGLYFYQARYYDAAKGRFLQRDPLGYEAGMNLYSYTDDSPANFTDPDGMFREFQGGTNCLGFATGHWAVQPENNESFEDAMKNDGWTCKEKDDKYSGRSKDCECKCTQSMLMLYLKPKTAAVDTWTDNYQRLTAAGKGDFHAVRCMIDPKAEGNDMYKCTQEGKRNWREQPGFRQPGQPQNITDLADADDTLKANGGGHQHGAAYSALTRAFCCCKEGAVAAAPAMPAPQQGMPAPPAPGWGGSPPPGWRPPVIRPPVRPQPHPQPQHPPAHKPPAHKPQKPKKP